MSKNTNKKSLLDFDKKETTIDLVDLLKKYLGYWPWFLGSITISVIIAFIYLQYADLLYTTEAKIKLIDDKKSANFSLDISKVFGKSTINLENEIALFKSYHLSEQVVENLKLNVIYVLKGKIRSQITFDPPFMVTYALPKDSLSDVKKFDISITNNGYTILDKESGKSLNTKGYWLNKPVKDFPITIQPSASKDINEFMDENYRIILKPIRLAALELSKDLQVSPMGKDSDIISLLLKKPDGKQAEGILNNLIQVFEEDGIKDNQEVSRRTIDFVDNRFVFLKRELEAIELSKKDYKKSNSLSFIQEDAGASIKIKSSKEQTLFEIESQLLLVQLLEDNLLKQTDFVLLPADVGVQNATINQLIAEYNRLVLEYQKLQISAGRNNPSVEVAINSLRNQKNNILSSVKGYKQQLETSLSQGELAQKAAEGSFSAIPEKEKVLRSIERQQNLKENLYLLLLQKREEASINLAVTIPNTKIIDYAITNNIPVYPKTSVLILMALVLGISIPFSILYVLFKFDNKIYSTDDIEKINSDIPSLGELPSLNENKKEYNETNLEVLEAFRTLAHNTEFITPFDQSKLGKIFFVTSSIKGEGKTFVSFNLASTLAQLGKKVLLVGTDLRNPQLHKYLDKIMEESKGLSNYLHNNSLQWQDLIFNYKNNDASFDVLLSGDIPPNPLLLLSSQRFGTFVNEVKESYDIIVFDTPPTLLVSDSLIISKYADTTLYVVRSGMTEKKLISYSGKLNENKKLMNMGYVINDISSGYNYGHNYGYGTSVEKKSLYKRWFKR